MNLKTNENYFSRRATTCVLPWRYEGTLLSDEDLLFRRIAWIFVTQEFRNRQEGMSDDYFNVLHVCEPVNDDTSP